LCAQLVRHYYDIESFNMFPVFREHLNICFWENAIGCCNHMCHVGHQTHLQFEVSVIHKFWTSNDVFVVAWQLKVRVIWGNSLTWEFSFKILVTGFSLFLCRVGGVRLNRWEGFSSIFCNCCFICLFVRGSLTFFVLVTMQFCLCIG